MCQMLVKGEAAYHQKAKESCMMEFHLPEDYNDLQRPRIFNTHFTPRCLPKKISDTKCKIILILRNPKDIITSLYHHILVTKSMDQNFDFSQFLQYTFENDRNVSSNWFFYNKRWSEFVSSTDQPVLILNYEDLKTNIIECLSEIGQFIGYPRDIKLLKEIEEKCTVSKMREIEKRRDSGTEVSTGERISNLYRKGVIGDWKNHFTVADNERFDAFLKENMEEKHSLRSQRTKKDKNHFTPSKTNDQKQHRTQICSDSDSDTTHNISVNLSENNKPYTLKDSKYALDVARRKQTLKLIGLNAILVEAGGTVPVQATRRASNSIIDLFLVSRQLFNDVKTCITLAHEKVQSDHIAVLLDVNAGNPHEENTSEEEYWNIKNVIGTHGKKQQKRIHQKKNIGISKM
ncbi:SULT6B1 [Mytilus coruscus]|uniref:SULT6B1 n=1 Tax=Mytilus coruscus TaxID=42192 RepID=A0A6J8BXT2_MYTCO|nr:SULT6B1 [Mytilus coruscus]